MVQAQHVQIDLIGKNDVAPPGYPAIAVVQTIDRRIILIMTADCGEQKRAGLRRFGMGMGDELRLAAGRVPDALAGTDGQAEAAGFTHAAVEVVEIGIDLLDLVADQVVMADHAIPIDVFGIQCRLGQTRDDGRFRHHQRPRRGQLSA
jgi:hypothetical protein